MISHWLQSHTTEDGRMAQEKDHVMNPNKIWKYENASKEEKNKSVQSVKEGAARGKMTFRRQCAWGSWAQPAEG